MSLTGLLFSAAFVVGCLLALVRHPAFGLLTYVGAFFLHPPSKWWGQGILLGVRWSFIAAGVTLLALLIHRKKLGPAGIPFLKQPMAVAYVAFTAWLGIQSFWALDPVAHQDLLSYYVKFGLVMYLVYRCIDSERQLELLLWAQVLGCFYFGWIAFTSYTGGRFEDFGGPGLSEANAGALTIVTGILAGSALFLAGNWRKRVILLAILPFIVNGLVTTISRSGFLAVVVGGLVFNLFSPKAVSKLVRVLSVLAVLMFGMLTGPSYWQRMQTMEQLGSEVQGVDTGAGRFEIMAAQLRMFASHPLGCGATCTAVLSRHYLDDKYLVGEGTDRARASHNTFFTMLVEHGIPGAAFYVFMALWIFKNVAKLAGQVRGTKGFLPLALPALASVLSAIFVSDMFATYAKFEVRIWFLAALMATMNLAAMKRRATADEASRNAEAHPAIPGRGGLAPGGKES